MRRSFIAALAATTVLGLAPPPAAAQSRSGLTAPDAGILFSGSLGVGRLAAAGVTGLGLHLQAGVTLPFSSTWAVSVEGRATRTPGVPTEHLIAGALLGGLRWYQNGH